MLLTIKLCTHAKPNFLNITNYLHEMYLALNKLQKFCMP